MARNDYYHSNNNFLYYLSDLSFPGIHLLFFVSVLFLVLASSVYFSYESLFEDLTYNLRLFLLACPLLLLLLLHFLSSDEENPIRIPSFLSQLPEKDSFHRAGGSPWGVAVVLILLLFMVSHRSALLERWFPLLSRR